MMAASRADAEEMARHPGSGAHWPALLALALLAACTTGRPPPGTTPASPPPPEVRAAPLPADFAAGREALSAFRRACPQLLARPDASGLTRNDDWKPACAAAESDGTTDATAFFRGHFAAVRLGDGRGLATGYYEPEIAGLAAPAPGAVPVLARPPELVEIDLRQWGIDAGPIRGLRQGNRVVRAPDRKAIEAGAFANRRLELAWAADRVEYFFLQIQGSGRLHMADGRILRIGYAGQNGWPYVAIGRLLRERGLLEVAGMAEIKAWLRANPEAGVALMDENPSYVFMRQLDDAIDGPVGALGVPLLAEANVAADPSALPLGAPVWIETLVDGAPFRKLLVAADTGGAIKGANRFDIFFGAGDAAAHKAGALAAPLDALLLLPKAAAARLATPASRP